MRFYQGAPNLGPPTLYFVFKAIFTLEFRVPPQGFDGVVALKGGLLGDTVVQAILHS